MKATTHTSPHVAYLSKLSQRGKIIAEYVWVDGLLGMRSKSRTLPGKVRALEEIPKWDMDGSSCFLSFSECSEIILEPVYFFPDPFRGGDNIIVLCEAFEWADDQLSGLVPCNTNFRHFAKEVFAAAPDEKPWFGIEQEYTLLERATRFTTKPYGWPDDGFPGPQGPFYCAVGTGVSFGRQVAEAHYKLCLAAGLSISGINAEVMPSQWEFQIGPCEGIEQGDQLWAARYLLVRAAEQFNLIPSFDPKLLPDWNGSGCHTNFSTETMRTGSEGLKYIGQMMRKFKARHLEHLEIYGLNNKKRLTGIHETSSYEEFSFGLADRGCSFRILTQLLHNEGKGYVEDRRPASNIDPYAVCAMIFDTACLEETRVGPLMEHYGEWKTWAEGKDIMGQTKLT